MRGAACDGAWQAAPRGRSQIGLDAQSVDQRALTHGLFGHLHAQMVRPVAVLLQPRMLQVLHDQNQRRRRLSPGHRADHLLSAGQVGTAAAQCGRNRQAKQAVSVQQLEVGMGKLRADIVLLGGFGQRCGQFCQPFTEVLGGLVRFMQLVRDRAQGRECHAGSFSQRLLSGGLRDLRARRVEAFVEACRNVDPLA
ncbi:hypothetical protein C5I_0126435 [Pseudomonas syringae pv. syringae FF5]|nr:hypothetical protein C5I_0126435 [Pseudomonas syringae pv. syringae FF5]